MTNLAHMYGTCGSSELRVPVLAPTKQVEVVPLDGRITSWARAARTANNMEELADMLSQFNDEDDDGRHDSGGDDDDQDYTDHDHDDDVQ